MKNQSDFNSKEKTSSNKSCGFTLGLDRKVKEERFEIIFRSNSVPEFD